MGVSLAELCLLGNKTQHHHILGYIGHGYFVAVYLKVSLESLSYKHIKVLAQQGEGETAS